MRSIFKKIINQHSNYNTIVISLPEILITTNKKEFMMSYSNRLYRKEESFQIKLESSGSVFVKDSERHVNDYNSAIIPANVEGYEVICGPVDRNVKETIKKLKENITGRSSQTKEVKKWFLQEYNTDDCQGVVVYKKIVSTPDSLTLFFLNSDQATVVLNNKGSFDMWFSGYSINISSNYNTTDEEDHKIVNNLTFTSKLTNCTVHNSGTNIFYIGEMRNFSCSLTNSHRQKNKVVTQGGFTDFENIHSVIGSNSSNTIEVSHASYVDGKGGRDYIIVPNNSTIVVKSYPGDIIYQGGLVLLPINFSDIIKITQFKNIIEIIGEGEKHITIDSWAQAETADGFFIKPLVKVDDKSNLVKDLLVSKYINNNITLENGLNDLQKIDNPNFNLTKQLLTTNYDITIGSATFHSNKENHNFYWESNDSIKSYYSFSGEGNQFTIAKANGILDFSLLTGRKKLLPRMLDEGKVEFYDKDLRVILLPGYKNVTVKFNRFNYYRLQDGKLERDYCSHDLKVDKKLRINVADLLNSYNCFIFNANEVLFFKLKNDLKLLSDKGILLISDYYSSTHKDWDLSIKLNNRVVKPEKFRKRTNAPNRIIIYKPSKPRVEIYHKSVNSDGIVLIDLKDKPISDFDMRIVNNSLILSSRNNTFISVENWKTNQAIRKMMFNFNDTVVSDEKCILSSCDPKDIIEEFQEEKVGFLNKDLLKAAENGNLDQVKDLLSRGAHIEARGYQGITPLYFACNRNHKDVVEFLLDQGANANAVANTWTPLQTATAHGLLEAVQLILNKRDDVDAKRALEVVGHFRKENESKIKNLLEERIRGNEGTIQHHIRHKRHKQHRREHLQERKRPIHLGASDRHNIVKEAESSLQNDEIGYNKIGATSGASKPSSWIDAVKGVFQFISSPFKPAIDMGHSRPSNTIAIQNADTNGALLWLNVLVRKITGQKYISTAEQPIISLPEAQCHASDIINGFEKVLKETAVKSGISVTNLNFDPIKPQSDIVGQLINGKFSEISKTLYSSAKQAYPECKQTKKFLSRLETRIEEFLDKKEKEFSSIGQKRKEAKQIRKQELCSSANFITDNPTIASLANVNWSESQLPGKTDNKPRTCLNDPTVDKQPQRSL